MGAAKSAKRLSDVDTACEIVNPPGARFAGSPSLSAASTVQTVSTKDAQIARLTLPDVRPVALPPVKSAVTIITAAGRRITQMI